jgi:signal transduction histidine kinase
MIGAGTRPLSTRTVGVRTAAAIGGLPASRIRANPVEPVDPACHDGAVRRPLAISAPALTDQRHRFLAAAAGGVLLPASAAYAAAAGAEPVEITSVVTVAGAFLAGGLVAWARRPDNRTGKLMMAAGFCELAAPLGGPPLLLPPVAIAGGTVFTVLLTYLILAFPSGELRSTASKVWAGLTGVVPFLIRTVNLAASPDLSSWGWSGANPYHVIDNPAVAATTATLRIMSVIAIVAVLVVIVVFRWWHASSPARRALTPVLIAGSIASLIYLAGSITSLGDIPKTTRLVILWAQDFAVVWFPIGFLIGFLRIYMTRSAIANLVVELGETPTPMQLQTALANALGDPTLTVAYWSASVGEYVGPAGERAVLPREDSGRAVTQLERDGVLLAAIIHDPALLDDPGLVASVASAMRLAVENERLQTQVERQLEEVRASRARIVEAGDTERKRLERDLHDGAQQRLVSLTLALRLARQRAGPDADPTVIASLEQASEDARQALAELRELARGIHPAILTDSGLDAAAESLADRSDVPAVLESATGERYSPVVERTAYFVVSEALANINKYARATRAMIQLGREGDTLTVQVSDDGVGGADPARGSGLRGLADRLSAVDGSLEVDSPPGGGTKLVARIPVGSAALQG